MKLEDKILELGPLYLKLLMENEERSNLEPKLMFTENDKVSFNKISEEIIEELIWEPGRLLYYDDPDKRKLAKTILELFWPMINGEEVFDEMTGGNFSGILVEILGNYTDRIEMLKPTFIGIPPKPKQFIFYTEAMKCWLFGLNNSAVILCASLLESILKEKLRELNVDLICAVISKKGRKYINDFGLDKLINNAFDQFLLSEDDVKNAHNIKRLRNNAVHKLRELNSKQTLEAIEKTKVIVENLLSKSEWE